MLGCAAGCADGWQTDGLSLATRSSLAKRCVCVIFECCSIVVVFHRHLVLITSFCVHVTFPCEPYCIHSTAWWVSVPACLCLLGLLLLASRQSPCRISEARSSGRAKDPACFRGILSLSSGIVVMFTAVSHASLSCVMSSKP